MDLYCPKTSYTTNHYDFDDVPEHLRPKPLTSNSVFKNGRWQVEITDCGVDWGRLSPIPEGGQHPDPIIGRRFLWFDDDLPQPPFPLEQHLELLEKLELELIQMLKEQAPDKSFITELGNKMETFLDEIDRIPKDQEKDRLYKQWRTKYFELHEPHTLLVKNWYNATIANSNN